MKFVERKSLSLFSVLAKTINSELGSLLGSCQILSDGHWLEADAFHVGADLLGDLLEDLLGQIAPAHALVELDELNDVSGALLPS